MNKPKLRIICLIVGVLAVLVGTFMLTKNWLEYRKGQQTYERLQNFAEVPTEETEPATTLSAAGREGWEFEPTEPMDPIELPEIIFPEVDFDALKEQNPDVVGWIYIEDTKINYPVVQGKDNDYYLERMFTGEGNGSGAIFLDAGNTPRFTDRNNILYGHNMQNGTMFNNLMSYKEQAFFEEHPAYAFVTPEKSYVVEIFACYTLSGWGDAWELNFEDDDAFQFWLTNAKSQSTIKSPVEPEATENILTLSTCTYEYDDARFVVMGIMHEVK